MKYENYLGERHEIFNEPATYRFALPRRAIDTIVSHKRLPKCRKREPAPASPPPCNLSFNESDEAIFTRKYVQMSMKRANERSSGELVTAACFLCRVSRQNGKRSEAAQS